MTVSSIRDGSGMLVRSVLEGGSVNQDGRLGVGDTILAINGEPTSNLTNTKARAMLRRHSVMGPEMSVTYVPAHQVDEHRARLCLPPLASIASDSASTSPTPPVPSPEPALARDRSPSPNKTRPSDSHLSLKPPTTAHCSAAPDSSSVKMSASSQAPVKTPAVVRTITPAPDSSWQIPKSLSHESKREAKEKAESLEGKKQKITADGKVLKLQAEIKPDGKTKENEEGHSHAFVSRDQQRSVQLTRAPGQSLGISIMGGRGMGRRLSSGGMMRGVFIKHISPDSPAAHNGTLRTGDRILEVSGVDLRDASHEQAVEAIRRAGDTVTFVVQSGQHRSQSPLLANHDTHTPPPQTNSHSSKVPSPVLDRKDQRRPTRAAVAVTATEDEEDTERQKMLQRYGSLSGSLHLFELEKDPAASDLGITLSGNNDGSRAHTSVFVADIDPQGPAGLDGRMRIGDELLEINGQSLRGLSHQTASSIIDKSPAKVKTVLIRSKETQSRNAHGSRTLCEDTLDSHMHPADHEGLSKGLHHIILPQDQVCLGLCLSKGEFKDGVVVRSLVHNGTASKDGRIQTGDRIVAVGDEPVAGMSAEKVSKLIQDQKANVKLSISRSQSVPFFTPSLPKSLSCPCSQSSTSSSTSPVSSSSSFFTARQTTPTGHSDWLGSSPLTSEPRSCPVVAGRETAIEIVKGSVGLGLSIIGGCDTLLGAVVIHEVNDGGAAQMDGRLQAGDHILEVNGIDLHQATHDEAIGVLRLITQRVCLRVFRFQEAFREEDLWDVFSVELQPHPREGLGFRIVEKSNDTGIFVSDIIRGGVADSDGRLLLGDQIVSINGVDARTASLEQAEKLLQSSSGSAHLEVARFKAGPQYSPWSQSEGSNWSNLAPSSGCDASLCHQRETYDNKTGSNAFEDFPEIRIVTMQKGRRDSLGISIAGGAGCPHGNVPLFIDAIHTNGLAAQTKQLQAGDKLLSINDVSTEGMTHVDAKALLKNVTGTISLKVTAGSAGHTQDNSDVQTGSLGKSSSLPTFHNNICARMYKTITLEKDSSGLGFSIVGGFGSPHGDLPIYIKSVFNKGAAVADGRLRRGDQIIAVNGHCLEGATHAEAVDALKKTKGTVVLTILS